MLILAINAGVFPSAQDVMKRLITSLELPAKILYILSVGYDATYFASIEQEMAPSHVQSMLAESEVLFYEVISMNEYDILYLPSYSIVYNFHTFFICYSIKTHKRTYIYTHTSM